MILLPPAYHYSPPYRFTRGPAVATICALASLPPDPEQQLVLDDVFGEDDEGNPAAFQYGLVGPRQQLKTGTLIQCALGWLFVSPMSVRNINWTAHLKDTASKSFKELADAIRRTPALLRRMPPGQTRGIHENKDSMSLETAEGKTLDVNARTDRGGRGLTGDRVVLDEGLYLTPEMMGSLLPTLTARRDAQALIASTAGKSFSAELRHLRDRGRSGNAGIGWAEWSTERRRCANKRCAHFPPEHPAHMPGCAMDDVELWRAGSPLLGRRRANGTGLDLGRLQALRNGMPPDEWATDFLGWWEEGTDESAGLFGPAWAKTVGHIAGVDAPLHAVGVAVSADLVHAALVGAGRLPASAVARQPQVDTPPTPTEGAHTGRPSADPLAVKVLAVGLGYEWVMDELATIRRDHPGVRVVADLGGPTGVLGEQLRKAIRNRARFTSLTFPQWKTANAVTASAVRTGRLHRAYPHPDLDDSVADARWSAGQRLLLDRYASNTAPVEAMVSAVYGVEETPKASVYDSRGVMTV